MVCLGNICRSPLAEGILKSKAKNLEVDSAGTAGYHVGKQPDIRSIDIAKKHNIEYKIIVSGGDVKGYGKSEAEVYAKILKESGIPTKDIILENKSLNTYQNAEYTKEIIKNLPYDNYLLVTSGIHMKRSLLYFKSFNINVIPAISDDPKPLLWIPVSYNLTLMDFAIHEYFSIYRFYLYDFLNINDNSNKIFSKSAQ